jgi:hypothetical protein
MKWLFFLPLNQKAAARKFPEQLFWGGGCTYIIPMEVNRA